jgi:hypothetical protein
MSEVSGQTAWVIVGREFGERLNGLPLREPAWVVQSSKNSAAAARLQAERVSSSYLHGITTFVDSPSATREELLADILATIYLHHGEYSSKPSYLRILVHGARSTPIVAQALREFGFDKYLPMSDGFVAERSSPMWNVVKSPVRS